MKELTVIELCVGAIAAAHAVLDRAIAEETHPSVKDHLHAARSMIFDALLKVNDARRRSEQTKS